MSAKAELYAEIGKLKSECESLRREAVKVPNLEALLKAAEADAKFFKVEIEKEKRQRAQCEASLEAEREAKKKLNHGMHEARQQLMAAEKKVHRLENDLKFDKMAREGQVKRARIIEHELTEVKHDNFLQTRLRKEAEHRSIKTHKELQNERSMRLQDIHSRNKVILAKNVSERNEKLAEYHRFQEFNKANVLESKVGGLEVAARLKDRIIAANDVELNASLKEIEVVKLESQRLKRELLSKSDEVLHHVEIRTELEQECHRLQTEMMVMARTHSDRTRPLSTAAAGKTGISLSLERARSGKTRPETTSNARIRRRAQTLRNREFSRTFSRARTPNTPLALMPPGSPLTRGALTLDEAFIIPIDAGPTERMGRTLPHASIVSANGAVDGGLGQTSPDGRLGTASVTFGSSSLLEGKKSPEPRGRLPSAMKKKRHLSSSQSHSRASNSSENDSNVPENAFGDLSLEQMSSLECTSTSEIVAQTKVHKRKKDRERTSLNTPGSLFLGSGLGLRKE